MPALTIGAVNVPVLKGGFQIKWTEVGDFERAFSGKGRKSLGGGNVRFRTISVKTSLMLRTGTHGGNALETVLKSGEAITVTGDLLANVSVSCHAQDLVRDDGPMTDQVSYSFTLQEIL